MNTRNTLSKISAIALLPALSIGIFASPAMASAFFFQTPGVTTTVEVENINAAEVMNAFSVTSNTGNNTANGGDGEEGGNSGNSGDNAGNGGDGGEGGNGGDAYSEGGSAYAESGYGANGGMGGIGGNTGNTGAAGNGGTGGMGGQIATGNAFASVAVANDVNSNMTDIAIEDNCDCDRYNEEFESAHSYYERNLEAWSQDAEEWENNGRLTNNSGSNYNEDSSSDSMVEDSHWEMYSKKFVPVTTSVRVANFNAGSVLNTGAIAADTGGNTTNGGDGDEGGNSGDSGEDAGEGGDGGEGGNGGDATSFAWDGDDPAFAFDGGAGGVGAEGGSTGSTGFAGKGGHGAEGGLIVTGHADSLAAVVNIKNRNVTRIVR